MIMCTEFFNKLCLTMDLGVIEICGRNIKYYAVGISSFHQVGVHICVCLKGVHSGGPLVPTLGLLQP